MIPVLEELNRRFPCTVGLQGEALDEAIAANWDTMDQIDIAHMFKRMALFIAHVDAECRASAAETPAKPVKCAYCGERDAALIDKQFRPICAHCYALPAPTPQELSAAEKGFTQ